MSKYVYKTETYKSEFAKERDPHNVYMFVKTTYTTKMFDAPFIMR